MAFHWLMAYVDDFEHLEGYFTVFKIPSLLKWSDQYGETGANLRTIGNIGRCHDFC